MPDSHFVTRGRSNERLAWLLRVNRVLGEESQFRSARRFAAAFRLGSGGVLSPSQVTRWETAQTSVSGAVIERYENLLGLPQHSLSTAHEAAATFLDGPVAPNRRAGGIDHGLHELLERACSRGDMRSSDWRRLTGLINDRLDLVLHPPDLWRDITGALLDELVVSQHDAWFARQEAMNRLMAHPASAPHAIATCIEMADDIHSPVFIEPISLLDAANHPVANSYVAQELREPRNKHSMQGALLAVTSKLRRGHYSPEQRMRLAESIEDLHRSHARHPAVGPLLDDVVAVLSCGSSQIFPHTTNALVRRLAEDATSHIDVPMENVDRMLSQLIAEALFSRNSDACLYAAGLIVATPYRVPVANAVANAVKQRAHLRDELFVERGLRLLTRLRTTDHQTLISRFLQDPTATAHTRHAAVLAAGHSASPLDEAVWQTITQQQLALFTTRPTALDPDILRGLVYSVGTAGHAPLLAELVTHPSVPSQIRRLALWWQANGVRDS